MSASAGQPTSPAAANSPGRLARAAKFVRGADWWHSKLPPLLAFAYLALAGPPAVEPARGAVVLLLFLASAAATAAWGHFLNDLADAEPDRRLGRLTPAARLGRGAASAVAIAGLAVAVAPWLALPAAPLARLAFGAELLLLALYALPPARLKERGSASVVVDALYGHALPLAITLALFSALVSGGAFDPLAVALLLVWKLAQGLCGALASQIADRRNDRRSGTATLLGASPGRRASALAARNVLLRLLLPIQFAAFVAALAALALSANAPRHPELLVAYALFLGMQLFRIHFVWKRTTAFYRRGYPGYALLNDFHERWLPLVALGGLVVADPRWAPLALAHLLLFRSALGDVARAVGAGAKR